MQRPITVNDQRAAALRFADPRVQALLHVLLLFLLVHGTFTHKHVREHLAPLLGKKPSQLSPGQITYDLRRLRLHGLTERIPKTHRYRITAKGLRTAIFYTGLTGVPTLIEQIQLVIRRWHGCLQGNVLKEAWKADFLEKAEAQNL